MHDCVWLIDLYWIWSPHLSYGELTLSRPLIPTPPVLFCDFPSRLQPTAAARIKCNYHLHHSIQHTRPYLERRSDSTASDCGGGKLDFSNTSLIKELKYFWRDTKHNLISSPNNKINWQSSNLHCHGETFCWTGSLQLEGASKHRCAGDTSLAPVSPKL